MQIGAAFFHFPQKAEHWKICVYMCPYLRKSVRKNPKQQFRNRSTLQPLQPFQQRRMGIIHKDIPRMGIDVAQRFDRECF